MLGLSVKKIVIFLSIVCAQSSLADSLPSLESLRDKARTLVSRAMQNGFESIDGLSLSDIAKAIENPSLFYMNHGIESAGTRQGGYSYGQRFKNKYYSESKFNPEIVAKSSAQEQARIGLHELLIATGYQDQNYTLSLGIWYASLATDKTPSFMSSLLIRRNAKKTAPSLYADEGSGTGVGGGGDIEAMSIKILLLDQLSTLAGEGKTQHEKVDLESLAQKTLDCDFEFYGGEYAVQPIIYPRTYMDRSKNAISVPMLDVPWGAIEIRRDWFENAAHDARINLLMSGLVNLANAFPTACQAELPHAPWERLATSRSR